MNKQKVAMTTTLVGGAICMSAALVGCANFNASVEGEARADDSSAAAVSPIESYKQKVVRDAMAGLTYDSGRVEIDRENPRTLVGIGDADAAHTKYEEGLFELGNHNNFLGAIRAFSDAVIMMPGEADYYVGLGKALDYKGKPRQAEAAYRSALDLKPDHHEGLERLAHNLYAHGKYDDAINTWQKLVERDPNNAEAHGRLALAYYYAGRYAESWRHTHRAEELGYALPSQFRPLLTQHMSDPAEG